MQTTKKSRAFLEKLLQSPPALPFEMGLLPTLFAVTREGSNAPLGELADLIERSQSLSVQLLSLANSAAYGLEFKVSTLRQAVSILGVREIRMLAAMVGMAAIIREAKLPPGFDANALWEHQLAVAVISRGLATELGGPFGLCGPCAREEDRLNTDPDEAYVIGLLHDIGKILFALNSPDLWELVEKNREKDGQRFIEAERAFWDIDHALIGAEMLHHWKLPLLLTEPVNWHHEPGLAVKYGMSTRLLAAANHIAHSGLAEGDDLCKEAVPLLPEGCDTIALAAALQQHLVNAHTGITATLVQ